MKPLRIDQQAEAELRAAISWYERERVGLGDEFWAEIQQMLRTIAEHRDVGGKVHRVRVRGDARRLLFAASHTSSYIANYRNIWR